MNNYETGLLEMLQGGLIGRVIEVLVLDDGASKVKWTQAKYKPLTKGKDGIKFSGEFSYSSVVLMMLYLTGHTHPEISYEIKCSKIYMFGPSHSH